MLQSYWSRTVRTLNYHWLNQLHCSTAGLPGIMVPNVKHTASHNYGDRVTIPAPIITTKGEICNLVCLCTLENFRWRHSVAFVENVSHFRNTRFLIRKIWASTIQPDVLFECRWCQSTWCAVLHWTLLYGRVMCCVHLIIVSSRPTLDRSLHKTKYK